jgi:hypothetical protein
MPFPKVFSLGTLKLSNLANFCGKKIFHKPTNKSESLKQQVQEEKVLHKATT